MLFRSEILEHVQSFPELTEKEAQDVNKIVFEHDQHEEDPSFQDPPEDETQFFTLEPTENTPEKVRQLIEEKIALIELKGEHLQSLKEVIRQRADAFLMKGCPIRVLVNHEHVIETEGQPFHENAFRTSPEQRAIVNKEIKQMLEMDVIENSESPWASRLLLVKKPDQSWRPCVDYRKLNSMTKRQSNQIGRAHV